MPTFCKQRQGLQEIQRSLLGIWNLFLLILFIFYFEPSYHLPVQMKVTLDCERRKVSSLSRFPITLHMPTPLGVQHSADAPSAFVQKKRASQMWNYFPRFQPKALSESNPSLVSHPAQRLAKLPARQALSSPTPCHQASPWQSGPCWKEPCVSWNFRHVGVSHKLLSAKHILPAFEILVCKWYTTVVICFSCIIKI